MNKIKVIAEAGVNHNGNFDYAIELINIASDAGADFVKFQTFDSSKLVKEQTLKADYQKINTNNEESQYNMLKLLEIPKDWYPKLITHCKRKNIEFLSTPFDIESIDFLDNLGQRYFKVPSGEITHKSFLKKIAEKNKPIFISTGMATIDEIKDALNVFLINGINLNKITLMHCISSYPTKPEEVNLLAMNYLKNYFNINIGYSDHTLDTEVSIAAVALGAKVIEKHFTLDKNLEGPDHQMSLEPNELKKMINQIRNVNIVISGSGYKEPSSEEIKNKFHVRKSLCYNSNLNIGYKLKLNDLIALRPEDGISPMLIDNFIGKTLKINVKKHQTVQEIDFI